MSDQYALLFIAGALAPITTEILLRAARWSWREKKARRAVGLRKEASK